MKAAIGEVVDALTEIIPTVFNAIVELFPVAIGLAGQRIAALQEEMEATNNE